MATTLTATVDSTLSYVVLRAERVGAGETTETIERSADGGVTWTPVRGSPVRSVGDDPVSPTTWVGYAIDTEMPLDTPLTYRATDNFAGVDTAGPVTVDSLGFSWMKDPGRPWANLRIGQCPTNTLPDCPPAPDEPAISIPWGGLHTEGYAADATLFPILNARRPGDVWAVRKDAVTSWQIIAHTLATSGSLDTFYYAGGPIFLQLDPVYGWPDRYYQPGQTDVSRLSGDLTRPQRFWDVPLATVEAPVGPAQGTCDANWCAVDEAFPTYADLAASGLTWGDVMEGDAATC